MRCYRVLLCLAKPSCVLSRCALAAATTQLRLTVQSDELWRLCDPAYVRQLEAAQEAAARQQADALQRQQELQAATQPLAAPAKHIFKLAGKKRPAAGGEPAADCHSGGSDARADSAAGHGSQAEGQRIKKRRREELRQRKQDAAGTK
jgi:hypothetical protein